MKSLTNAVKKQLNEIGVITLYLFGSRAQKKEHVLSDFDFAILLEKPQRIEHEHLELYHKLYSILTALAAPATHAQDIIDIVFLDSPRVPLELKSHIVQKAVVLYDAQPERRKNFERDVMLLTADFQPLRMMMNTTLLHRPPV